MDGWGSRGEGWRGGVGWVVVVLGVEEGVLEGVVVGVEVDGGVGVALVGWRVGCCCHVVSGGWCVNWAGFWVGSEGVEEWGDGWVWSVMVLMGWGGGWLGVGGGWVDVGVGCGDRECFGVVVCGGWKFRVAPPGGRRLGGLCGVGVLEGGCGVGLGADLRGVGAVLVGRVSSWIWEVRGCGGGGGGLVVVGGGVGWVRMVGRLLERGDRCGVELNCGKLGMSWVVVLGSCEGWVVCGERMVWCGVVMLGVAGGVWGMCGCWTVLRMGGAVTSDGWCGGGRDGGVGWIVVWVLVCGKCAWDVAGCGVVWCGRKGLVGGGCSVDVGWFFGESAVVGLVVWGACVVVLCWTLGECATALLVVVLVCGCGGSDVRCGGGTGVGVG
ncbi:hypothetical protein Tco_1112905 [Tanacetum coccineum]|uniref:Uncharacterized protein n=1 Tax=Tanacetum coccineum TaxID=301880 RepID=A0ABQ5IT10_9ASTR